MELITEFWKWAITIGVTINAAFLGILLKLLFSLKSDVQTMIVEIKTDTDKRLQKICDDKNTAHAQIWERIHHHGHTETGAVIIRD